MTNTPKKALIISLYVGIIATACTIPYLFESPSIFYKTGLHKYLLRAGKIAGIIAASLICFQVISAASPLWLKNIFGNIRLIKYHRQAGLTILALIILHALFILAADDFVFFPFESNYWPEFTGIGLFAVLVIFIAVSYWQKKSGIPYKIWRHLHQKAAVLIVAAMVVHIINVSESFESGTPFLGVIALVFAAGIIFILKHIRR